MGNEYLDIWPSWRVLPEAPPHHGCHRVYLWPSPFDTQSCGSIGQPGEVTQPCGKEFTTDEADTLLLSMLEGCEWKICWIYRSFLATIPT